MDNPREGLQHLADAVAALDRDRAACAPAPDSLPGRVIALARALVQGTAAGHGLGGTRAWEIMDSDGFVSIATKRVHAEPFASDPRYSVRPLVYGDQGSPPEIPEGAPTRLRNLLSKRFAVLLSEPTARSLLEEALAAARPNPKGDSA